MSKFRDGMAEVIKNTLKGENYVDVADAVINYIYTTATAMGEDLIVEEAESQDCMCHGCVMSDEGGEGA